MMSIRTFDLNLTSIDVLEPLVKEWGDAFWSLDEMARSLALPGYHLLCYYDRSSRMTGLVFSKDSVDSVELLFIYVITSAREEGLGKKLLQTLIDHCQLLKRHSLFLEVRKSHSVPQALYYSLGFIEVSIRPRYYKDGEDAVIMERKLP